MLLNLSEAERQEIKDVADDIAQLPPLELPQVHAIRALVGEEIFWKGGYRWACLGRYIWTYLSDIPDPLQDMQLDENFKEEIRVSGNYYLKLASLVFKAEHYIKLEAQQKGVEYPFSNASNLFYFLALEECFDQLQLFLPENERESPSKTQFKDRFRDSKQWLNGNIENNLFMRRLEKWKEEEKKNFNSNLFIQKTAYLNGVRWIDLCNQVFYKYQEYLPDFYDYKDLLIQRLHIRLPFAKKFAFINGSIQVYPGRGKSEKNK